MAKLVGLSGSLRKASYNTALLKAAAELMPSGSVLEVRTIHGIPLFDEDAERASGIPQAVAELKDAIAAADGLLLATPEYNNSLPGPLKNAIDWTSRPASDIARVWSGKAVALVGATPGGWGTLLAQAAWLPVFRHLGARPWFQGRLHVSGAGSAFDGAGTLADAKTRDLLRQFVEGFVAFVNAVRS